MPIKKEWREVVGFPLYRISNYGAVMNARTGEILKSKLNTSGYEVVYLSGIKRNGSRLVHRLIMEAFVRQFKPGEVTNHLNGVKTDNRLENLEITTTAGNIFHAVLLGLMGKHRFKASLSTKNISITIKNLKYLISLCENESQSLELKTYLEVAINLKATVFNKDNLGR